ncbi:hypothetical protein [Halovivax cerinus]|uniref:DUF7993 domain-containing protein n=1 Tax=Halovivax cerinus TaxID=1487865 RepID=A0ABD5NMH4_9EURY|nr:hypothetical protein [Halovivax cerinus]
MVDERVTDGIRIAELLASEVEGRGDGPLGALRVTDANQDVEPSMDGARAYSITRTRTEAAGTDTGSADESASGTDRPVATVNVHDDRIHLAVRTNPDATHEDASAAGLRTRPKATEPPQTLVFVESGAEVKRAATVLASVADEAE